MTAIQDHATHPAPLRLTIRSDLLAIHLEYVVQACRYDAIEPTLAVAVVTRHRHQPQISHWQAEHPPRNVRLARALLSFEADWRDLLLSQPVAMIAITRTKSLLCAVPAHWLRESLPSDTDYDQLPPLEHRLRQIAAGRASGEDFWGIKAARQPLQHPVAWTA